MEDLLDLLVANVRIIIGPFYLGADGKLCATQSVTVREWSQVVTAINELKPMLLRNAADEDDASPADRRAIAKFSKDADATLLRLDGNVLISQWPMSRASYDSKFGDKSENPSGVEEIRDAGIRIEWKDGVVTFTLGKKDDVTTELTLDSGKTPYTPNAVAPARGRQLIKDDFDPKAAAQVFLLRKEGD